MKYLCLVYCRETDSYAEPVLTGDREYAASVDQLIDEGSLLAGEVLESVHSATTVRVRNGKVSVADGPFAETREQLVAFYLVSARDLNEAILIAAEMPAARVGSVEVRPVRDIQRLQQCIGNNSNTG